MSISFISLNARGLRNNVKRKALFLFVKNHGSDFCFFQETHSTQDDAKFWRSQWGSDIWMSHGTERSAGVAILKNKFAGEILHLISDPKGHFLLLVISLGQTTTVLLRKIPP